MEKRDNDDDGRAIQIEPSLFLSSFFPLLRNKTQEKSQDSFQNAAMNLRCNPINLFPPDPGERKRVKGKEKEQVD